MSEKNPQTVVNDFAADQIELLIDGLVSLVSAISLRKGEIPSEFRARAFADWVRDKIAVQLGDHDLVDAFKSVDTGILPPIRFHYERIRLMQSLPYVVREHIHDQLDSIERSASIAAYEIESLRHAILGFGLPSESFVEAASRFSPIQASRWSNATAAALCMFQINKTEFEVTEQRQAFEYWLNFLPILREDFKRASLRAQMILESELGTVHTFLAYVGLARVLPYAFRKQLHSQLFTSFSKMHQAEGVVDHNLAEIARALDIEEKPQPSAQDSDPFGTMLAMIKWDRPETRCGSATARLLKIIDAANASFDWSKVDTIVGPAEWRQRLRLMPQSEASMMLKEFSNSPKFILRDQKALQLSSDGTRILAISPGVAKFTILGVENGVERTSLTQETRWSSGEYANCLFDDDGARVWSLIDEASEEADGIRLWDAETGDEIAHLGEGRSYYEMTLSLSARRLFAICTDCRTAHLWDIDTLEIVREIELELRSLPETNFSADGKSIVIASEARLPLILLDAQDGVVKWRSAAGYDYADFHPDGSTLIATSEHRTDILDASNGKLLRTLDHSSSGYGVGFSPDGRFAFTAALNDRESEKNQSSKTFRLWELPSAKLIQEFKGCSIFSNAYFDNSSRFLCTIEGQIVRVRDLKTGLVMRELDLEDRQPRDVFFAQKQNLILVNSDKDEYRNGGHRRGSDVSFWDAYIPHSAQSAFTKEEKAFFAISLAELVLSTPRITGDTPGEREMQLLQIAPSDRTLVHVIQGETNIWPSGEDMIFDSLINLLKWMGQADASSETKTEYEAVTGAGSLHGLREYIIRALLEFLLRLEGQGEFMGAITRKELIAEHVLPEFSRKEAELFRSLAIKVPFVRTKTGERNQLNFLDQAKRTLKGEIS